jgi:hypothetical protein
MNRKCRILCLVIAGGLAWRAQATVTNLDYWRMGENDPGAANGVPVTNTVDSVGGRTLTGHSGMYPLYYSSDVSPVAAADTGSSLCMEVVTGSYATGPVITNVANNFGVELWVYPVNTGGSQCLVYNGNTGSSGWGLFLYGTNFVGLYGGDTFVCSAPATAEAWVDLALVCDNGVTTLYTNGVAASSAAVFGPLSPAGSFLVGADNGGTENFSGYVDEVRVFDFVAGQFSPQDLLVFQNPSVTTLAATGLSNTVATLNSLVNPNGLATTAWFEWGPYAGNNPATAPVSVGSGLTPTPVSLTLTNLTPGMIYNGRIAASNGIGGAVRGAEVRFGNPALVLNGAAIFTNECHTPFVDPGATAFSVPVAISAGDHYVLAVKGDGTVVAWGQSAFGQTNVPPNLSGVVNVSAGFCHSLAVTSSGGVQAWGENTYQELNIPPGLSNIIAVAAGGLGLEGNVQSPFSLALARDGDLAIWGSNAPPLPGNWTNLAEVSAGAYFYVGLQSTGTLLAVYYSTPPSLTNATEVAAGEFFAVTLGSDGTVGPWGADEYTTNIPSGLTNAVAVAAGGMHALALTTNGAVMTWGDPGAAVTNVPAGLRHVIAVAAGGNSSDNPPSDFSLAVKSDGTVIAWGDNSYGQTNVPPGLTNFPAYGSNNVNVDLPGDYVVTYSATNVFGGSNTATLTVRVVDTTPPVITVLGQNPMLITNRLFVDPGATALDACCGPSSVTTNGSVNVNFPGVYAMTYTSTDCYSNTATSTRLVAVALPPAVPGDTNGNGILTPGEVSAVLSYYNNGVVDQNVLAAVLGRLGAGVVNTSDMRQALSNYFAGSNSSLIIMNPQKLGGGLFQFSLGNSPLWDFNVQASSDFRSWTNLGATAPINQFYDPAAASNSLVRFYRLVWP